MWIVPRMHEHERVAFRVLTERGRKGDPALVVQLVLVRPKESRQVAESGSEWVEVVRYGEDGAASYRSQEKFFGDYCDRPGGPE